jgi:hypothetical protein
MTAARIKINDDAANPLFNLVARSVAPTDAVEGDIYLDDGTNTTSTDVGWMYYNGTTWEDLGGASGGGSGAISADTLVLNDGSELTIATGAITVTKARHTVDTEADAASDDLVTINSLAEGEICIISASHTDRTVVVKNGGGNIACSAGADISLDATEKEVLLYGRASTVLAIPLYNLGSSGGGGADTALSNLASVAINTSLISDTDDTDDLGSASIQWKDIWAKSSYANTVMAAYNNSGSTIAIEQVVYINGHNAGTDEPTIALADRDSAASAYAVGITQASINNAASGRIVTHGIVTYPTTGMAAGDVLYLSSTAGGLTNTKPTSGYLQVVAVVVEVGGTGAGRILFIPQTSLDLDSFITASSTTTLTNKTISHSANTIGHGSGATKTIATGVASAGTDRNLIIAAESGTADDLIEITGLSVGESVLLRADTGDTITVVHNDAGATVKTHLHGNANITLDEQNPLRLTLVAANVLVEDVQGSAGSGATVVAANKVHKFGSAQTTTSGTMTDVDATNAAITATLTGGGKCLVTFVFQGTKATAGSGFYRITDGTNHSNEVEMTLSGTSGNITVQHIFDTSAGSTTYKLQQRTSDANAVGILQHVAVVMTLLEIA